MGEIKFKVSYSIAGTVSFLVFASDEESAALAGQDQLRQGQVEIESAELDAVEEINEPS